MVDIEKYISLSNEVFKKIDKDQLIKAIDLIKLKINTNKKIITCGNGGSALTASHYITDWNKAYNIETGNTLKGFSLSDNIGLITAIGNDESYDDIFSSQLKTIADAGDLLIAISGSGNSKNIIKVLKEAKNINCESLLIVGYDGGKSKSLTDYIKAIEDNLGIKAIKELLPLQPGDVPATFADCTKLESFINYKPNTSIEDGIRKFITWYKEFYGR